MHKIALISLEDKHFTITIIKNFVGQIKLQLYWEFTNSTMPSIVLDNLFGFVCFYLWNKNQSHRKIAAEDVGESNECKGRVRFVSDSKSDGGRYNTEDSDIVDRHPDQSAVINLLHLYNYSIEFRKKKSFSLKCY